MSLRIVLFVLAGALGFFLAQLHVPDPVEPRAVKPDRPETQVNPTIQPVSDTALRDAFALPPGPQRRDVIKRQLDALMKLGPEAALRSVMSLPPGSARDEAASAAFVRLIKEDFAAAINWADRHPALVAMVRPELESALGRVAAKDGAAAWSHLQRLRELDHMIGSRELLAMWAAHDSAGAATFGMKLPEGEERDSFMKTITSDWIRRDGKGFLTWLRTQTYDQVAKYMLGLYTLDPKASWSDLLEMAEVLPLEAFAGTGWATAVKSAFSNEKTRNDAATSMPRITDPELREQTWLALALASAQSNPAEAQRYIKELHDPRSRATAASAIAAHLAIKDPAAALAYANQQTNSDAQGTATSSALATWLMHDRSAARTYLAENLKLLDVELVDRISGLASREGPAEFATWALSLEPSPQRTRMLRNLSTWLHYEPEEFRSWALEHAKAPGFQNALPGLLEAANHYYLPSSASLATVIELLPDAAARQKAAVDLLKTWRFGDPAEASRWHDAQVKSGRISAVPVAQLSAGSPAQTGPNMANSIQVPRPAGSLTSAGGTTYRTYHYNAGGRSFTVFY